MAAGLSPSVTVMKTVPDCGQLRAGRGLRLAERGRVVGRDAHHLAGRLHLRAEQRVGAREAAERQHRLLHRHVLAAASASCIAMSASRSPSINRQAIFASGTPIAFDTNGTVRDARGLASIT